ncbi:MAG: zinc ribbon domain-containing protein [Deltaproteobacteria bacterium]|nr:zinc ribbon domain-containing protein [Deltaproteobacteria bacterium]
MPIFEYSCQKCAHSFEVITRHGAAVECPSCHGGEVARKLSVFAVSSADSAASACGAGRGACGSCGVPGQQGGGCGWEN